MTAKKGTSKTKKPSKSQDVVVDRPPAVIGGYAPLTGPNVGSDAFMRPPAWQRIKNRIEEHNRRNPEDVRRWFANDNIAEFMEDGDKEELIEDLTKHMEGVLDRLVIDWRNDHNSVGTPARLAKMMFKETMMGRYHPMPDATDFPNVSNLDQMYVVGPIEIKSMCSHHHLPVIGHMWVGVLPGDRVVGLSKFHRVARWLARRPQIQEEFTVQIADALERIMEPRGLGVVVRAKHYCCVYRGVEDEESNMTSSMLRGVFFDPVAKQEFLQFVAMNPPKVT